MYLIVVQKHCILVKYTFQKFLTETLCRGISRHQIDSFCGKKSIFFMLLETEEIRKSLI